MSDAASAVTIDRVGPAGAARTWATHPAHRPLNSHLDGTRHIGRPMRKPAMPAARDGAAPAGVIASTRDAAFQAIAVGEPDARLERTAS